MKNEKKDAIVILLLLVSLVIGSNFTGYFIGVKNRTECSTFALVPVEVENINTVLFIDIFITVLPDEQTNSINIFNESNNSEIGSYPNEILWTYYFTSVSYENDTLYVSTINATILAVELIITEIFYYFSIVDWFYTYVKYDLNTTSFTLSDLNFWRLMEIEIEGNTG